MSSSKTTRRRREALCGAAILLVSGLVWQPSTAQVGVGGGASIGGSDGVSAGVGASVGGSGGISAVQVHAAKIDDGSVLPIDGDRANYFVEILRFAPFDPKLALPALHVRQKSAVIHAQLADRHIRFSFRASHAVGGGHH